MLTFPEKIIFIFAVIGSLYFSYKTFRNMFRVISRGDDPINWQQIGKNAGVGISTFLTQRTLFKTRSFVSIIHAFVAWGFTLYILVNFIDVLYGMTSSI